MATPMSCEEIRECAQRIDVSISNIFAQIGVLSDEITHLWQRCNDAGRVMTSTELASLKPLIESSLSKAGSCLQGTGVVLQPGVLQDKEMYLEWRQLGAGGRVMPLSLNFNRGSESFYDYSDMPWFSRPRNSGRSTVVGPYVDLYGQDMYILTFSMPILVNGQFIGVAAADVALNKFERVVTSSLMRMSHEALILSSEGRVVATNTANWTAGEMASLGLSRIDSDCQYMPLAEQSAHWTLARLPERRRRAA
ncbi:cache domain-containing protein [Pseudomonas panipatensis]|uniref:cache domain-containing protein n=1 Tax=Pseudomonas panipatensis TaxID=428992 RepID=UPI0035B4DCC0